jgi:hypothetical protein
VGGPDGGDVCFAPLLPVWIDAGDLQHKHGCGGEVLVAGVWERPRHQLPPLRPCPQRSFHQCDPQRSFHQCETCHAQKMALLSVLKDRPKLHAIDRRSMCAFILPESNHFCSFSSTAPSLSSFPPCWEAGFA